jgi:hypothetical protein
MSSQARSTQLETTAFVEGDPKALFELTFASCERSPPGAVLPDWLQTSLPYPSRRFFAGKAKTHMI